MTSDPRIPRSESEAIAPSAQHKADLRKQLLTARRAIDPATRAAWDHTIGTRLVAWWHRAQASSVTRGATLASLGVYWPLRDEPDLHAAYAELARAGARLLLPVVVEKHAALAFAEWRPGEAMVRDAMGVAVPADLRLQAMPDALLVPCLGFNGKRYRLGYGGGYYDRTLAATPRPRTVGVAYGCLRVKFAHDGHDVPLDVVMTEDGEM